MDLNVYRKMMDKIHVSDEKRKGTSEMLNRTTAKIDPEAADNSSDRVSRTEYFPGTKAPKEKASLKRNGLYRLTAAAACFCVLLTGLFLFGVPKKLLSVGWRTPVSSAGTGNSSAGGSCSASVNRGATASPTEKKSTGTSQVTPELDAISAKHEAVYPKSIAFSDYKSQMKIRDNNPVADSFSTAVQNFSWKTASTILSGNTVSAQANANYSPISLYMALALTGTGAKGQTGSEIYSLLGVSGKNAAYLSAQSGNLYRRLYTDNSVGKLKIANSLWMDKRLTFGSGFINNAVANFYSSLYSVDFLDKNTPVAIGEWISENTNGLLSPKIQLDRDTILSIVNTIYFKDSWSESFQKSQTVKDTFTLANGKQITCDFMSKISRQRYTGGSNFTSASLGLNNGERMVFVLPNKGTDVKELLSTPEKTASLFDMTYAKTGKVIYKIPKFSFDSNMNLEKILQALGMPTAFTRSADFSGIHSDVSISKVQQQLHIAVDENGVEAAAYTVIGMAGAAAPNPDEEIVEMNLDRPFIFAVLSKDDIPLFIGICRNPA